MAYVVNQKYKNLLNNQNTTKGLSGASKAMTAIR